MKYNYSIDEILLAVTEIQDKKKEKHNKVVSNKLIQNDYSSVPKNTLKLIEEAEKNKD
tara:strand:- start:501 stop:674 length:174 start_codon:yes stop_codon:yes gene_type:complete